jgi:hypothetical protein
MHHTSTKKAKREKKTTPCTTRPRKKAEREKTAKEKKQ